MQHEKRGYLSCQRGLNGLQMFGALGQHEHLPALVERARDLRSNRRRTVSIIGYVAEYILNSSVLR